MSLTGGFQEDTKNVQYESISCPAHVILQRATTTVFHKSQTDTNINLMLVRCIMASLSVDSIKLPDSSIYNRR